jgi:hypothetical protein
MQLLIMGHVFLVKGRSRGWGMKNQWVQEMRKRIKIVEDKAMAEAGIQPRQDQ